MSYGGPHIPWHLTHHKNRLHIQTREDIKDELSCKYVELDLIHVKTKDRVFVRRQRKSPEGEAQQT